jgi:hypothetical protein
MVTAPVDGTTRPSSISTLESRVTVVSVSEADDDFASASASDGGVLGVADEHGLEDDALVGDNGAGHERTLLPGACGTGEIVHSVTPFEYCVLGCGSVVF